MVLFMSELFMVKKHWNAVKYRIALIFPSLRAISYYSLGFQILYRMLNSYPDVLAERFTYDSIYSIESFRPLNEFDIVMVSSNYEMNYPLLAQILKRSGINPEKTQILVGGITTFNPGPLLGMGLYVTPSEVESIIPLLYEYNFNLDSAAEEGLVISPKLYNRAKVLRATTIAHEFSRVLVLPSSEGSKIPLEITRGCPFRCKFCLYGNVKSRVVYKTIEDVQIDLSFWMRHYPHKNIEIISSEPFVNPDLEDIIRLLVKNKYYFSFPSLRVDRVTEDLLEALHIVGNRTVTIAPEHSERLRRFLGKVFSDDDIIEFGKIIKNYRNIRKIKMYILAGVKGENLDDFKSILELKRRLESVSNKKVSLSINYLVPKAFTYPISELSYRNLNNLKEKTKLLRKMFNVSLDEKKAYIQALFSLGGPDVGKLIIQNPFEAIKFSFWKDFVENNYDPVENPWNYKRHINT